MSALRSSGGLRTRSLRNRVTATVLVFVAAMLLVLGVTTSLVLGARLEGEVRQRLTDRASYAAVLIGTLDADDLVDRLEGDGVSVRLQTADGQVVAKGPLSQASTPPTAGGPKGPGGPAGGPAAPVTRSGDLMTVTRTLSDGSEITLWASVADARRTLDQVRTTLLVGGVALLGLAAIALGPVIGRALAPLDQITATARSITAGDRGRRLRPDRPGTELGRTATAFDEMLDEVEGAEGQARHAEGQLRVFLSDAAHELRTPLTGIQAAAERLLRADLDRDGREQLSVTVIRESRRAGRLVDDLLTMSRIDQGLQLQRRPTDLTALVRQVVQTTALAATDARIGVSGAAVVAPVDPDRITQLISNLVDNAIDASTAPAEIMITVATDGPTVQIDVADHGPGVPAADRERIFDRLVRLDPSRTHRRVPRSDLGGDHEVDRARGWGHTGSGLGLPIARGVARAHGGDLVCLGEVRASPTAPGARFRLTLPLG